MVVIGRYEPRLPVAPMCVAVFRPASIQHAHEELEDSLKVASAPRGVLIYRASSAQRQIRPTTPLVG